MDFEFTDDQLELRDNARAVLAAACPPSLVRSVYEGRARPATRLWKQLAALDWPALGHRRGARWPRAHVRRGRHRRRGARPGRRTNTVPGDRHAARSDRPRGGAAEHQAASCPRRRRRAAPARSPSPRTGCGNERRPHHGRAGPATVGCSTGRSRTCSTAPPPTSWPWSPGLEGSDRRRRTRRVRRPPVRATAVRSRQPLDVIDPTMPVADISLDRRRGRRRPSARRARRSGGAAGAMRRALEEATTAMALSTAATCRAIFETTLQYAKDREQFGRPIGSFQAIKHRLADMYLAVERASALAYYAALTIAEDDDRRSVAASMAKAAAGDCQRLLVGDGLQLHGGIGFTWEHDLHFLLKRAKSGDAPVRHGAPSIGSWLAGCWGWRSMRLRFDDSVEAFRAELLAWLAANRPSRGGDGRRAVDLDRARAGVGSTLDAHDVRRRLARARLAAGARRAQRQPDRDARVHRGAGQGPRPADDERAGARHRRPVDLRLRQRGADRATTPCRSSAARRRPASG